MSPDSLHLAPRTTEIRLELAALLGRVASGDREALLKFVDLTYDLLVGWIRAGILSRSRRESLIIAVYLEVWSTANEYDPRARGVYHWLADTVTRVMAARLPI